MDHKLNLKKQLACIYTSDFFSGLRITDAVWVALLAARGFSLWEIGLAESVYHIVSLFCEVPSGMAADLLGRRKTLLSGGVLTVTCNLLMAFAPNLFTICLAMGLNALAMTMFSGTFTALVYDSLKTEGREDEYIQVSANSSQISMLANAIGSLASLLKRFLGFAGFYLLSAAFEGVSTAALALMEEPIVTESQASREKHPLRALPEQFRQLVRDSLHVLHTCPMAVKLIASSALISVPSYLTKMFLQQRLVELGWPTELLFLPLLLGGLACVAGTEIGRRVRCRSMRRLYTACALLCGVGTLLVGTAPAWGGILGMMLVQGVLEVYLLHESQKLNDAIPSDQRATLISVDGMAYSLLMIPASPLVGAVGDAFGQAGAGLALLGGVIVLSGVALLGKKPQEF
jgi:MFS family permease